jgi:hypothetical protein
VMFSARKSLCAGLRGERPMMANRHEMGCRVQRSEQFEPKLLEIVISRPSHIVNLFSQAWSLKFQAKATAIFAYEIV